jgi:hypothetical protein
MRVAVKVVIIGICLSGVALAGACASKSTGTASPTPSPPKLTPREQATVYFKQLTPVVKTHDAVGKKMNKLHIGLSDRDDAYSIAAAIKSTYLPAVEQVQGELAAVKPPPAFRAAHARLRKVIALEDDMLYFLWHALQDGVYAHTLEPGFENKAERYVARLDETARKYNVAMRAAAKGSGVKIPKLLLAEFSL